MGSPQASPVFLISPEHSKSTPPMSHGKFVWGTGFQVGELPACPPGFLSHEQGALEDRKLLFWDVGEWTRAMTESSAQGREQADSEQGGSREL